MRLKPRSLVQSWRNSLLRSSGENDLSGGAVVLIGWYVGSILGMMSMSWLRWASAVGSLRFEGSFENRSTSVARSWVCVSANRVSAVGRSDKRAVNWAWSVLSAIRESEMEPVKKESCLHVQGSYRSACFLAITSFSWILSRLLRIWKRMLRSSVMVKRA